VRASVILGVDMDISIEPFIVIEKKKRNLCVVGVVWIGIN